MRINMMIVTLVIVCSLTFSATVFGAYGGGGSSSSSILTKDVCPTGDASSSYYDGSCVSITEQLGTGTSVTFATQSVKKAQKTPEDYLQEVKELKQTIITKKQELERDGVKITTQNMPPKYLNTQLKIQKLLAPWLTLSDDERNKKIVVLLKKIDMLQASKQLPEKLLIVIEYVQNAAILMANF